MHNIESNLDSTPNNANSITHAGGTCRSTDFAVSKFTGYGMPWVMIVVSNATKGWRSMRACSTSGWRSMGNPLSSTEIKQVGRFLTEYDNAREIGRSINQSGENKRAIWCNSPCASSIVGTCILYIIWITSLFSTPSLWPIVEFAARNTHSVFERR